MTVSDVSILTLSKPSSTGNAPYVPWQRLYFLPLPHGHFSFRPILVRSPRTVRFSAHQAQVQAGGCALCQLVRVVIVPAFRKLVG
jgi:hypothetical protein